MSGEDLTASRVRRMLPSVSEVLKELTARAPIEPEIAFRAAREVCAEELKRIRDVGGESVPLEDLVQKAFLRATGASLSVPPPPPPPLVVPPYPPASAREPLADPQVPGRRIEVEDPFAETTGAMDLRWDRDAREPFTETPGSGAPAASGPPEEEAEPIAEAPEAPLVFEPEPGPAAREELPVPFALPVEDGAADDEPEPPAFDEPELAADDEPEPEAEEGPGNETLSRLSREAESIDLKSVFPMGPSSATVPFALASADGDEGEPESPEPEPVPFVDDEDTVLTIPRTGRSGRNGEGGGSRIGVVLGTVAGLAALAGLGYILVGLWVERSATPPPVAVARPRSTAVAAAPAPSAVAQASVTPAAAPVAEGAPLPAEGTVVPVATPVAERRPAVAQAPAPPAASPPPAATVAPTVGARAIARAVPPPSNGPAPAPVPVSMAPVPTVLAAVPARLSRDGLIVTKDRAGQAQVFSVHFTSYKDRASAERDLKRVQGLAGREGYVAEVELGEKGVWYRVMVGTFETAEQAKAVREELAAKGTRDLGWVYRVIGSDAPERR